MSEAIKRILVPLDPSPHARAATQTACEVARKHKAELAGVAVLDSSEIRANLVPAIGPYYPMMIDAVQEKVHHADKLLDDCLEEFAATCEREKVRHFETEYEGIPAQKLLESSIFFDLIVMGLKTSFHFETRGLGGESLDNLLDRTSTPVLAVPTSGMLAPSKVLIAFDGSFGATRALHDFVGFGRPYDFEITVISADMKTDRLGFLLDNAKIFLENHGFSKVACIASGDSIEKAVDEDMTSDFDLIVAGIHSRKTVKDYFLGSFAKQLIQRDDTPLFLSH
ncbi:MAG: universal stress protein [Verrucomicrobiales bacterium]